MLHEKKKRKHVRTRYRAPSVDYFGSPVSFLYHRLSASPLFFLSPSRKRVVNLFEILTHNCCPLQDFRHTDTIKTLPYNSTHIPKMGQTKLIRKKKNKVKGKNEMRSTRNQHKDIDSEPKPRAFPCNRPSNLHATDSSNTRKKIHKNIHIDIRHTHINHSTKNRCCGGKGSSPSNNHVAKQPIHVDITLHTPHQKLSSLLVG